MRSFVLAGGAETRFPGKLFLRCYDSSPLGSAVRYANLHCPKSLCTVVTSPENAALVTAFIKRYGLMADVLDFERASLVGLFKVLTDGSDFFVACGDNWFGSSTPPLSPGRALVSISRNSQLDWYSWESEMWKRRDERPAIAGPLSSLMGAWCFPKHTKFSVDRGLIETFNDLNMQPVLAPIDTVFDVGTPESYQEFLCKSSYQN